MEKIALDRSLIRLAVSLRGINKWHRDHVEVDKVLWVDRYLVEAMKGTFGGFSRDGSTAKNFEFVQS